MIKRHFSTFPSAPNSCKVNSSPDRNSFLLHSLPCYTPSTASRPSIHSGGYTLIELIVVIVLIGLMFSMSLPKFRQTLLSDTLESTSLNLIGVVQELRERAVTDQVTYELHFDIPGKRIWAFPTSASEEDREMAREQAQKLPPDIEIMDVWSVNSGKFYNEGKIRFSKKGYVEESMIHLQSEDGEEVSLELSPFLGSIKIHEGYVDLDRD